MTGEQQVEDDDREDLPAAVDHPSASEHEQRAEDPEDRARRADRDVVGGEQERAGRAGEAGGP